MKKINNAAELWHIKHRKFKDVLLNSCVVVGYMGGGKTIAVNSIIKEINQQHPDYKAVNILTKFYGEIHQIEKPFYEDVRAALEGAEILNIFIDDALTSVHSTQRNKALDINFAAVRHYFKDFVNSGGCTINIFFATQRYQLLAPFQREAPIFIAKAIDLNPTYDFRSFFKKTLGDEAINWLRNNAYKVLIEKNRASMGYFILKAVGRAAVKTKFKKSSPPPYIILDYPARKEAEKEEKAAKKEAAKIEKIKDKRKTTISERLGQPLEDKAAAFVEAL